MPTIRLRYNGSIYVVEKVVTVSDAAIAGIIVAVSLVVLLIIIPFLVYAVNRGKRRIVIERQLSINSKQFNDVYDMVDTNHYQTGFPEVYADVEPTPDGYVSIKRPDESRVDYLEMNKVSNEYVNKHQWSYIFVQQSQFWIQQPLNKISC